MTRRLLLEIEEGKNVDAAHCGSCDRVAFAPNFAATFAKRCREYQQPLVAVTTSKGVMQLRVAACLRDEQRARDLAANQPAYLPWENAGGPNECVHGYAEGIPCPRCDQQRKGE